MSDNFDRSVVESSLLQHLTSTYTLQTTTNNYIQLIFNYYALCYFFLIILTVLLVNTSYHRCTQPIFTKFSRLVEIIVDDRPEQKLSWKQISGRIGNNWLTLYSLIALAFRNRLENRNVNGRANSGDDSSTSSINLVSYGQVTQEFKRLECAQQAGISTRVSFTTVC